MDQVRVAAWASDPIALAGLINHLQARPEVQVLPGQRRSEAAVLVFATNRVTPDVQAALRAAAAETPAAIVLVAGQVEAEDLQVLADCHVVAVLPRAAIAGNRLVESITAAASGRETSLRDLLGRPEGVKCDGESTVLSDREVDVLRLMAEGWDTAEIAGKLCYSERTVKNVIYAMTNRLKLRNRPHAVAYALRAGVI
ncbi:response regulator transcription factor [Amycolatopsis sp. H20-H5]|uniref:response regulator transcription factor n=1 Tax=Amycolatopsis sp. H20-H5 TaxID=3046309 RepID=UPI002DBD9431|nr:LuxR C-terminal-related transcriptional regulator [Amycolatopsis sp. H20-H5]MEC3982311.1 LuxR C-terminal-related transcriptional regulator [Amycolatopsis sp. H20-H5]